MLNNISLNFNLREPNKRGATPIYVVLRIDNKQYKIPTGCAISPWLWDSKKQIPILLNNDKNIIRIFNIISGLRLLFWKKCLYVCNVHNLLSDIKAYVHNMNEQNLRPGDGRKPRATTLLKRAFTIYYDERKAKDSTQRVQQTRLTSYYEYCRQVGNDKMSMLRQAGINEYRDYLVSQTNGCNRLINDKCALIVRLVNLMATHSKFNRYHIQQVKYMPLPVVTPKGEHKKRRPLTRCELQAIADCEGLTAREQEYRDLFMAQCSCGCRASDLWKLFSTTEQEHYAYNGKEAIVINTKKEDIKAVIMLTSELKAIQTKYAHGFKYAKIKGHDFVNCTFNANIRSICRKAGLLSTEQYIDAHGHVCKKQLCEIISSHFARYTFIKDCIERGLNPDEIKDFTGHADATMINEVYAIITGRDKAKNVFKALERVNGHNATNKETSEPQPRNERTDILHLRDILAWFGEPRLNYMSITDPRELIRLITTKYEVPLSNMGWSVQKLESLYKAHDMEGYKHLRADIEKLRPNSLNQ